MGKAVKKSVKFTTDVFSGQILRDAFKGAKDIFDPKMPRIGRQSGSATVDKEGALAADRERRRRAGSGRAMNILTGPMGDLAPANIAKKTLLGE